MQRTRGRWRARLLRATPSQKGQNRSDYLGLKHEANTKYFSVGLLHSQCYSLCVDKALVERPPLDSTRRGEEKIHLDLARHLLRRRRQRWRGCPRFSSALGTVWVCAWHTQERTNMWSKRPCSLCRWTILSCPFKSFRKAISVQYARVFPTDVSLHWSWLRSWSRR